MSEKIKVNDLRSAIKLLRNIPGEIIETDVEVNPHGELSGVYRYIGAGELWQDQQRKDLP